MGYYKLIIETNYGEMISLETLETSTIFLKTDVVYFIKDGLFFEYNNNAKNHAKYPFMYLS